MNIKEAIGMSAGILSLIATLPYILAILRKQTVPSRTTWLIWSVLSFVIAINYVQIGGGNASWLYIGYAAGVTIVALLSIPFGQGGWTRLDKICFAGVILSLAIRWFYGSAELSLYTLLAVDILGAIPTIVKTYQKPEEEDRLAWILGFSANFLNLFAVESWSFKLAIYPIYLVLMTATVAYLCVFHRTKKYDPAIS